MRSRMTLVAALGAAVAFIAAGCGGGSQALAGSGALGDAAGIVPADAVAFVAVDTDLGSGQWQSVNGLLAKFPAHDALVTQLRQSFEKRSKLSWANDVKPALGRELDAVLLPAAAGGKAEAVVLVQPADAAALDALVAKLSASGGTKVLSQSIGDWTALSESRAALDAVAGATSHLADDGVYQEATGKLAGDALVHAYANGAEAKQLLAALGKSAPAGVKGKATLVWGSADVVATSGGLKVDGYVRTEGGAATEAPYSSALLEKIPAGALFVADFQAHPDTGAVPAPGSGSSLPSQLQSLLAPLAKIRSSLGGETALYVSPGLPIPSVTLVTHAVDPQATVDALDQALAGLGSAASGSGSGSGSGLDLGSILSAIHLSHQMVGSDLVVSTSPQAIADFRGTGQKLADDGTFKEAQSASAMPGETTGFLYANLKDAVPSVQGLAGLAGLKLPAPLTGDLSALRTLTAYGTGGGDTSSFTVFLEVS